MAEAFKTMPAEEVDEKAAAVEVVQGEQMEPLLDLEEDKRTRRVQAYACYGTAAVVISLLSSLIIACAVLSATRIGVDYGQNSRRTIFLAAEYVQWSYALGETNMCYDIIAGGPGPGPDGDNSTVVGIFKKATFRQYTNRDFDTPVPRDARWEHLGLLGPVVYAEAGDTIDIVMKNGLDFPITLEPSGLEWSLPGLLPAVVPTRVVVYTWQVPESAGPAPSDPQSSRLYFYRSTVSVTRHENVGLAGPIIVTRKGDANPDGSAKDVDRDIITIFEVFNENETPANFANLANPSINTTELFRHGINGHSWCTLPGLEMVAGERVRWHVGGLGSEEGLHNFHWHGNVLSRGGRVMDQFQAVPGSTVTADMLTDNPGTWLFHCHVNEHLDKGMVTTFTVHPPPGGKVAEPRLGGVERRYYIQVEEVEWDYTPQGGDACGPAFTSQALGSANASQAEAVAAFPEGHVLAAPGNGTLSMGRKLKKSLFFEYTDASFTTRVALPPSEAYLGLQGPVIKANVGDTIIILLRNNASYPATLHPHGVLYNKSSEGAPYNDGSSGYDKGDDYVQPGAEWTYVWQVPDRTGPSDKDASSVMWMYHSHVDESLDTNGGLFGAMIIYPRPAEGSDLSQLNTPKDVAREVVLFLGNMEESATRFTAENAAATLSEEAAARGVGVEELMADEAFAADNQRPSINGYSYCNMPGLSLEAGSRVRFYLMVLGAQQDMHSPIIDGASGYLMGVGHHVTKLQMSAGTMLVRDLYVAQQGVWRIMCGVQEHLASGMAASYTAVAPSTPTALPTNGNGTTRTWYVAVEEVVWDFAPGYNGSTPVCTLADFSNRAAIYLNHTSSTVGRQYIKARYSLFRDPGFSQRVALPEWHGLQGPLLAAEVGDTLEVVLKNSLADRSVNLRPLAPLLALAADGSLESSQGAPAFAPAAEPGQTLTYRWYISPEAGPGSADLNTVSYAYSSSVSPMEDENLGLVGGLVVGCSGCMDWSKDALAPLPQGVDRMEPLLWQVFDENLSPTLARSMEAAGTPVPEAGLSDPDFMEANMKHSVNGFMYCTAPVVRLALGQRVRWIMVDFGGATALHSPYFQGMLLHTGDGPAPTDVLFPGQAITVDMLAAKSGTWPMYCQVHDHMEAGMMASFSIQASQEVVIPWSLHGTGSRRMMRR